MPLRVRALCTRRADTLTPAALRADVAGRLPALAAMYGEEGHQDTLSRLRVDDGEGGFRLRYREEADRSLRVERRTTPAAVAAEVDALRAGLAGCDEEGVDDVRDLLDHVVEVAWIELEMGDVEGIGWAVAIAAAACFAETGEGLVQADGEGWMEPQGLALEQVLDGD